MENTERGLVCVGWKGTTSRVRLRSIRLISYSGSLGLWTRLLFGFPRFYPLRPQLKLQLSFDE